MFVRNGQRATRFTRLQSSLAAIVAVPFAVLFAIFALTALLFSGSVAAAAIGSFYLLIIVLTPRAVFRRSLRRGHDRPVALKFAVYTLLALDMPLIPWVVLGAGSM